MVAPEEGADQEADSEESSSRESEASEASSQGTSAAEGESSSVWMIVGIVAVVVLAAAGGAFVVLRKKAADWFPLPFCGGKGAFPGPSKESRAYGRLSVAKILGRW